MTVLLLCSCAAAAAAAAACLPCCLPDDAEVVIKLMPSCPDGFYHKGFALFQLHDYGAAVSETVRPLAGLRVFESTGCM
jgi:hypothetical protein